MNEQRLGRKALQQFFVNPDVGHRFYRCRQRWRLLGPVLVIGCIYAAGGLGQTPEKRSQGLPQLSLEPDRALCDAALEVRVVSPPTKARIRFTTDGTVPTLANGMDYQAPWSLTGTTILRVAAFLDGKAICRPSTHTYLFLESTLHPTSGK